MNIKNMNMRKFTKEKVGVEPLGELLLLSFASRLLFARDPNAEP